MNKKLFTISMQIEVECESEKEGKEVAKKAVDIIGGKNVAVKAVRSKRTIQQNSALHKHLKNVSDHCMEKGLTAGVLFKNPGDIPITPELAKKYFRDLGKWMYQKESTADLDKKEMSEVINTFERITSEKLDFTDPFPSIETMIDQEY